MLSFLAQEIRRLNDPRLELVTLTAVDLSPDLKDAAIFWSVLTIAAADESSEPVFAPQSRIRQIDTALRGVTHLLKRRIGAELELRYIPSLSFRYDNSFENASRIEYLVKKAGL